MMVGGVHEALKALSPTDHTEFPSGPSTLNIHLATSLADSCLLISSIPSPSSLPTSLTLPEPPNTDVAALQKEWKPVKLSPKDNPLGISVYKLPAKDGKGAWFARRSIHTDIPFTRFKAGLQQEFQQSTRNGESTGPGSIRGIGKDTRVYHETCELGKAEIFQLSAQFPGPSAPRDFVEGCLSSSAHPEDISSIGGQSGADPGDGAGENITDRPRQFTLISKPVLNHPECNERSGYVRGTYESVEFIRETPFIPASLTRSHSTPNVSLIESPTSPARPRGKTVGMIPQEVAEVVENWPVDWIMITRSDPGGSVPRWLVERGTPGGIVKDAEKFIKFLRDATYLDDTPEPSTDARMEESKQGKETSRNENLKLHTRRHLAERKGLMETTDQAMRGSSFASKPPGTPNSEHELDSNSDGGLFSGALTSMAVGMTSLAQSAMSSSNNTPPSTLSSDGQIFSRSASSDPFLDDFETASTRTFATCDSSHDPEVSHSPVIPKLPLCTPSANQSPEERALAQFLKEKQKLNDKLEKEEYRRIERESKLNEKYLKNMEKQEQKYRRSLEKANDKRRREEEKKLREAQKKLEKDDKGRRTEIEELKKIVEGLTRENLQLRQRVEDLEGVKRKDTKPQEQVHTAEKVGV